MLYTHSNHRAVANMGNAKNSFKLFIHWPDFGIELINSGLKDNNRYGATKPMPKNKKTGNVTKEGCIKAYPIAAPINGAVHGDATTTAKTPVIKDLV